MSGSTGRIERIKYRLAEKCRPLMERRSILLMALMVIAALPGLVQFEWRGSDGDETEFSSFSTTQSPHAGSSDPAGWPETSASEAPVDVEWDAYANVETAEEDEAVDYDCMIEPWESVSVRSPVIGRIDAIHVERADLVKPGDLLVELDADLSLAELDMARQRASMTASLKSYEARKALGSKRGDRAVELFSRNAIALDARDELLMEEDVARFEYLDARDQHQLAQLQLDRERARFEQRRIRSPFAGVVADRLMSVGEIVDEETVLELAQIDPLRVEVILPAVEFGNVQTGMKAAVVPEIPGDQVLIATIRVVDRIIDSASGTFGAELELPNPNHEIPGGLRCQVRFVPPQLEPEELAHAEPTEP